jgi:hypothetical protein
MRVMKRRLGFRKLAVVTINMLPMYNLRFKVSISYFIPNLV